MRRFVLLASLFLSACLPDLGGWSVEPRRVPAQDGGTLDGGGPTGPRTGGPCGTPTLFVAAHELSGDGPGRVLRYQMQGTGGLVPCGDVTGGGALSVLPWALAPVSERFLLVATDTGIWAIDPVDDRVLWSSTTINLHPNDAFVLDDPVRGGRVPVVAWSNSGSSSSIRGSIVRLEAYAQADGAMLESYTGSELMLGNATAMTASPRVASEILAMNSTHYALSEIDFFNGVRRDPQIAAFTDTQIHTISAGRNDAGAMRILWTVTQGTEKGMFITNNDPFGTDPMLDGVGSCGDVACNAVHAAVDPTLAQALYAICQPTNGAYQVTHFDLDRVECRETIDGSRLGTLRPAYLAVLP